MVYCCDQEVSSLSLVPNSTNRVCPKGLSSSWFYENGRDCNAIFIEFSQKGLEELSIPDGIIRWGYVYAFPHRKCV